jgi:hypothetical protein
MDTFTAFLPRKDQSFSGVVHDYGEWCRLRRDECLADRVKPIYSGEDLAEVLQGMIDSPSYRKYEGAI